ncbi:DUF262 domain-containing HNH endonuclease family protein [Nocardioides sp. WL0053]|uniref:DUF262 domain-containing HNH endonuclease family protein n=1 Tax=Nocardioides jiangsuensis TaxID=2866161 RepID=A0ABS7RLN2_9ACTN|nr:DUF262 domain-containing protein [Nocardioides jiangsuensis]MBY9075958.1 DUF262 domain-containing HNH endonuclease family protein [Nocardioides jiangsuensis]
MSIGFPIYFRLPDSFAKMGGMYLGTPAILKPRKVGDLEGTFFVPDYQRGYRWGEAEVRQLLDDIKEAGASNYYLQPVVVKPMEDGCWELVDGQQRLTTLYLILRSIKNYLPQSELRYTLTYETRPGSAEFLDDPQAEASSRNIDYFHMYEAFVVVQAWFAEQENATLAAINLFQALTSTVYVIWYEAPQEPEFDSRALFTRLNVGRIPLTDAELVKASLLSRIEREHETAAQWDSIERDLWSPEIWAFATGSSTGPATRIGLLLDTLADSISGKQPRHRVPFQTFETLRPHIVADPQELWDQVIDLHSLVLGWHDDRNLFHKIGYLVASGRATFFDLVALAQGLAKSTFEAALDSLIAKSLDLPWHGVAALTYGGTKTNRTLLLMNVETIRRNEHSSERYSFNAHARQLWSLEHIHAQNSQGLNTVEQWTAWLKEHRKALDALDVSSDEREALQSRIDAALPTISSDTFEPLHREIVALFTPGADSDGADAPEAADRDEVDSIANLALLSREDNSVLSNSVFEVKRRHIINLDQSGSYIPVCTRNVFLKYYDKRSAAQQLHFWGPRDREAYLEAMRATLDPYLLEDIPENDQLDESEEVAA